MATTVQEYIAGAIPKVAADLEAALNRIPEDKRAWSPMGEARTALDMMAEVAMLNGNSADMLTRKTWPDDFSMDDYFKQKAELAQDWSAVKALFDKNTARLVETVRALSDDDLATLVDMPWGPMTLQQIASYPSWNMSYHEGQINYIASMLGCLG